MTSFIIVVSLCVWQLNISPFSPRLNQPQDELVADRNDEPSKHRAEVAELKKERTQISRVAPLPTTRDAHMNDKADDLLTSTAEDAEVQSAPATSQDMLMDERSNEMLESTAAVAGSRSEMTNVLEDGQAQVTTKRCGKVTFPVEKLPDRLNNIGKKRTLHVPPVWLVNDPPLRADGNLQTATNLKPFLDLTPINLEVEREYRAWDNEAYVAINKYFWGQRNGIIVEMGALDGKKYSASRDFLPLGWHRVLLEGSPAYRSNGPIKSPDASFISGAICDGGVVHYLWNTVRDRSMNGIAEFMSPHFLDKAHRNVWDVVKRDYAATKHIDFSKVDWKGLTAKAMRDQKGSAAQEVPCVSLRNVFATLGVPRVNFFVLDVEGGELAVLKGIDFEAVQFDVLCVETDPEFRPKNYPAQVKSFLSSKGYKFVEVLGRNTWFVHSSFQPRPFKCPEG